MPGRGLLRSARKPLAIAVVVAAAAVLYHFLPVMTQVYAPFDVYGTSGDSVSGRAISATVHGGQIAPKVTFRSKIGDKPDIVAVGKWVVVDATIVATRDPASPKADLLVAGNSYKPDSRFLRENLGALAQPDIPQRGAWIFDVASDLLDDHPSIVLRVWADFPVSQPPLDSQLVITIDPRAISSVDAIALSPARIVA
jgi:hypothetical protein